MLIEPKIIGGVCLSAHPLGLKKALEQQIEYVKEAGEITMPKRVLVLGGSTGYGLATRISSAFGGCAGTINISLERVPTEKKPASPGWYSNMYFDEAAKKEGLIAESLNADAFAHETRLTVIDKIRELFGQVDLVVYSLASPARKDPNSNEIYKSVLKPLGKTYTAKSVDFIRKTVAEVSIEAATEEEELNTVKVMGGGDWMLWINALLEANVLAEGAKSIAYSYIGPEITYAIYRSGTIGSAKENLEKTAGALDSMLKSIGGEAFVSVNKALVTRASSVIPVVPLYISLLYKIMKEKGIHEGCIEQMYRMLRTKIYGPNGTLRDENGLVHMDDWEMRKDVQDLIGARWDKINNENLESLTDIKGFREDFMRLHGFDWPSVDYGADVNPMG
ncbi:Short-chain alcohol dehydrogenase family [Olavius algarvensis spirochete endosymbiont]|uniref:enoyl-ACP reductase FabV n=1 Tax=Olavius algarvensis spirochete endosymbiont TaxID=260710 RepID=UPI00052D69A7|nr:enoyl-ACP reductase FabV [Olavius algarvensis spirochete endosymbiont]KGM38448.1 trans-2-enoyl-CoA reductase [Alkalispirochaeta odontotermitis]VDA99396.1 Short-chain alcohol dehydrogenase family [Olavius algarvensis spirochete endosymbiont]